MLSALGRRPARPWVLKFPSFGFESQKSCTFESGMTETHFTSDAALYNRTHEEHVSEGISEKCSIDSGRTFRGTLDQRSNLGIRRLLEIFV